MSAEALDLNPYAGREVLSLFRGIFTVPIHRPSRREIAIAVADRHGLTLAELMDPHSGRETRRYRQEAMYVMYQEGRWSNTQIGRFFGGLHYSTVMYARDAHSARMAGIPARKNRKGTAR